MLAGKEDVLSSVGTNVTVSSVDRSTTRRMRTEIFKESTPFGKRFDQGYIGISMG